VQIQAVSAAKRSKHHYELINEEPNKRKDPNPEFSGGGDIHTEQLDIQQHKGQK
jgi:hypothetical protein